MGAAPVTAESEKTAAAVGTTKKGLATRDRIITGAREALERDGMASLTTRKIAASANVRLATLHYYFDSKESLLLAVLEDVIGDMSVSYEAASLARDPDTAIAGLLRLIWSYITKTRERQIAQYELTIHALRNANAQWLAERQYNAYIDFYSRFVPSDPDLPEEDRTRISKSLARFILIGIDGLILQVFALDDEEVSRESVEALILAAQNYFRHLCRTTRSKGR
ncbi:TetR/AcrR family transcriptional regulator [Pseudohoeflea suaedae]|uniref:TetR/AcrR family transcriptional regulator n=1 Tax=Pseudohoeflea suaedae TaxID=877384 RepID=A0A4R5PIA1_9HYPH|nr:TetR/AcrR family transcriptional regulator [Pseudohoeflea suaedae]TDH34947.1 TetR/AcrR family transcriptional regulator [Pseudohoeflea suaedae]